MAHIITGEIRKQPLVRGDLYIVELAESFKDRDGNRKYTNYKFFFNAKSDAMRNWYNNAFQVGKVVSIQCDTLKYELGEYNGKQYVTLTPADFPKLVFSQYGESGQQQQQQQMNYGQQQQQQQQKPQQQQNFDDDIPF